MVVSAHYLLRDQSMAEEAAQEAFVAVWRNRKTLDSTQSIRAYIKTATTSRALNILKSRKHHIGDGPDALEYERSPHHTPDVEAENRELGETIRRAVDTLPDRCREVFVLSKYEGKSYKEISALLDISTKTVENQMTKALKTLRTKLKPYLLTGLSLIFFIFEWGKTMF